MLSFPKTKWRQLLAGLTAGVAILLTVDRTVVQVLPRGEELGVQFEARAPSSSTRPSVHGHIDHKSAPVLLRLEVAGTGTAAGRFSVFPAQGGLVKSTPRLRIEEIQPDPERRSISLKPGERSWRLEITSEPLAQPVIPPGPTDPSLFVWPTFTTIEIVAPEGIHSLRIVDWEVHSPDYATDTMQKERQRRLAAVAVWLVILFSALGTFVNLAFPERKNGPTFGVREYLDGVIASVEGATDEESKAVREVLECALKRGMLPPTVIQRLVAKGYVPIEAARLYALALHAFQVRHTVLSGEVAAYLTSASSFDIAVSRVKQQLIENPPAQYLLPPSEEETPRNA